MASYAYFDTKRKIKREPEIGCIFGKSGCIRSKVKREPLVCLLPSDAKNDLSDINYDKNDLSDINYETSEIVRTATQNAAFHYI